MKIDPSILKSRKFWATSTVVCFVLIVLCWLIFWYYLESPLNRNGEERVFVIEKGQNLEEIAKNLEMDGIIGSQGTFVLHVWFRGKANNLQAGKYSLSSSMSIIEIAKKIINGEIIKNWVKVTIPEGWDIKKIEEKLKESEVINRDEKILQENEGYLFPDTYYFDKDTDTIDTIVKKMRDNFDRRLKDEFGIGAGQPTVGRPASPSGGPQGDKTIHEILIMASILEKEVVSDTDRAIVAGIFWKRLENKYPLQSCATIAYILGVDKWRYSVEETKIKSPYNTYLNIGLPPTPINNPGLSAIRAAIYPQESDYYFFLTDPETGNTIFSKTFEEHNANKRKYFQ